MTDGYATNVVTVTYGPGTFDENAEKLDPGIHRFVANRGVRCPRWCEQHAFAYDGDEARFVHILDIYIGGVESGVWISQADLMSLDGERLEREPAEIALCEFGGELTVEEARRLSEALTVATYLVGGVV